MDKRDFKLFINYFLHTLIPSGNLWWWLAVIVALFIAFSPVNSVYKYIFVGIIMIAIAISGIYKLYKSGQHRFWNRQQMNILSHSEVVKLKEKI